MARSVRPERVLSRQEAFHAVTKKFEQDLRRKYPNISRRSLRIMARKSVRLAMNEMPGRIVEYGQPANWFERLKEWLGFCQVRYQ